jgi:hypothetical protein
VCPLPLLPVLFDYIAIIITEPKVWSQLIQLLDKTLFPLPPLDLVLRCISSRQVILELMNNYLRPRFYSFCDLIQEVSYQLLKLVLTEITQSLKELAVKLELQEKVKSFTLVELLLHVWINKLSIDVRCNEVRSQRENLV